MPAFAQSSPAPPSAPTGTQTERDGSAVSPPSNGQIEDIIITAQRTEESLQKSPISVTAYSGRELEIAGTQTVRDLILSTPNLQEARPIAGDGTNAVFFLRGLGLPRGSLGVQPAVGIYIDDFYYPSLNGGVLRLVDLSSVEVLRGPQGTLFGRNTLGGALRYNTRPPSTKDGFTGHLDLTAGSFNRWDISGSLNIPLGDTLAMRVSGARFDTDGYITSVSTGKKVGNIRDEIGRVQLRWTPSSSITDDLGGEYSRERYDGSPSILAGISGDSSGKVSGLANIYNNGLRFGPPPTPYFSQPAPAAARYDSRYLYNCKYCQPGTNSPDFSTARIANIRNTLAINLSNDVTLKSLTGYFDIKTSNRTDLDHTPVFLVQNQLASVREKAFSQELQLTASTMSDRLKVIAGLYYYHKTFDQTRDSAGFSPGPGAQFYVGTVPASAYAADRVSHDTTRGISYAAYAQASLAITDKLTATIGGRYSKDKVRVTTQASTTASYPNGGISAVIAPPQATFNNFSPTFKLQYQWTPTVMTYGSVSKGYRSGSVNTETQLQPSLGLSVLQPDTIWSYEIGARTELFDRHLQLNLTGFTSDYKGVQLLYAYPPHLGGPPVPPTIFTNGGDATVRGIEFETRASAGPFQFRGSAAYLDARYTRLTPPGPDTTGPTPVPVNTPITLNSRFQHAPEFTYSIGVSYYHALPGGGIRLGVDYSRRSSETSTAQDADSQVLPAYGIANFRANYDATKNLSFSIGVQNIFNKYYLVGGADLRGSLGAAYLEPGAPRTISVGARFQF